jgi:hypothetical protein
VRLQVTRGPQDGVTKDAMSFLQTSVRSRDQPLIRHTGATPA